MNNSPSHPLSATIFGHSGDGGGYMMGGSGGSQLRMVETLKTSIMAGFRVLQK